MGFHVCSKNYYYRENFSSTVNVMSNVLFKKQSKNLQKNYKCLFVIYSMFQCSVSVLNVQCYMFKLNVCLFNFISSLIACRELRSQRRKKKKKIYFLHVLQEN